MLSRLPAARVGVEGTWHSLCVQSKRRVWWSWDCEAGEVSEWEAESSISSSTPDSMGPNSVESLEAKYATVDVARMSG